MNTLIKFGSFLGALSFAVLVAIGIHQKVEVNYINSHQPPTLTQLQENVVQFETDGGAVCSGWISAKDGKIHTAAHCFDFHPGEHEVVVYFSDKTIELWKTDWVSTVDADKEDFATLIPKTDTSHVVSGLKVCTFKPYYGEFIAIMGAPYGVMDSMSFGYIQKPDNDGVIILDAKILPGNSGGAVIDTEEGCVLGQAEAIFNPQGFGETPYGINIATPVK